MNLVGRLPPLTDNRRTRRGDGGGVRETGREAAQASLRAAVDASAHYAVQAFVTELERVPKKTRCRMSRPGFAA
jgi:hypothetical protein